MAFALHFSHPELFGQAVTDSGHHTENVVPSPHAEQRTTEVWCQSASKPTNNPQLAEHVADVRRALPTGLYPVTRDSVETPHGPDAAVVFNHCTEARALKRGACSLLVRRIGGKVQLLHHAVWEGAATEKTMTDTVGDVLGWVQQVNQ